VKLKKGDNVLVISGKDRGKRGTIEKVFPKIHKVTVTGVNISKHHLKPSRKNPHGGIIDKLSPIMAANVVIICPRCNQPTRVGYKVAGGKKIRLCRRCKESLDA
jgi:large subunit ribosomal protein L24